MRARRDGIEVEGITLVALERVGTAILEGLDLRAVEPGRYFMVALPLNIPRCDGRRRARCSGASRARC